MLIPHDPPVRAEFTRLYPFNFYLLGSGHTFTALVRALKQNVSLPPCILLRHLIF